MDRFNSVQALQSNTVAGNAATLLYSVNATRNGLRIHNFDTTRNLWLAYVNSGDNAPAMAAATVIEEIPPQTSVTVACGEGVKVYGQFATGGAVTALVNAQPLY